MSYATRSEQQKYQREWCAKNRAAFLDGKSCVVCGTTERLEVDHIDPALKVSHNVWSWAPARRAAELAKCQVLCNTHHKAKTRADRPVPEHGTISRYGGIHKCRCVDCRKANSDRAKTNRALKAERDTRADLAKLAEVVELRPARRKAA